MATLFRADDLQVTDDWIRATAGTFHIPDVRSAWVTRRQAGRGNRMMSTLLGVAVLLLLIGGAGATGWLTRNWVWLLATPVLLLVAAWIGLLDPLAVYLEKRQHELWIATDAIAVRVWKANSVEAGKALRAIQRARERYQDGT
jgi:hypothetical protein